MTSTRKAIDALKYDTDKAVHTHCLRNYEEYFRPLPGGDIRLLELGVFNGGSLLFWRDYFERGLIVGLDINPLELEDPTGRIRFYQGGQHDKELLERVARECAPEGFDVIIDDTDSCAQPLASRRALRVEYHSRARTPPPPSASYSAASTPRTTTAWSASSKG